MASSAVTRFFHPAPFDAYEDPRAAPGAYKGPSAADPWTLRRGRQNLLWAYLCGLVFLIFPAADLIADQPSRTLLIVQGTALAAIAVAYLLTPWMADTALPTRWAYIAGFVGLLAATSLVWGWASTNFGVYVAVMIAALIPWRQARLAIAACGMLLVIMAPLSGQWTSAYIALIAVGGAIAMGAGLEAGRVGAKLSRAEKQVSRLAVVAERERISRDLHDILGHSLTAISIKSELAGRLVASDPPGARAQMAEVEGIARQALADVRATASGIREVRVATELASARSVLLAAGVEARVPSAVPPLPEGVNELFGYVIREAVTNVVRHSEASHCTIDVGEHHVSVVDDGAGSSRKAAAGGTGLRGLAARVEAAGGRLEVDISPGSGTRVTARVDLPDQAARVNR
ncbi:MAG TPA: sensor histidine kinase [Propionibacteriaceae bacterium]|nr:sensor histidine kinase [Propionibacteriaceae bacterium]